MAKAAVSCRAGIVLSWELEMWPHSTATSSANPALWYRLGFSSAFNPAWCYQDVSRALSLANNIQSFCCRSRDARCWSLCAMFRIDFVIEMSPSLMLLFSHNVTTPLCSPFSAAAREWSVEASWTWQWMQSIDWPRLRHGASQVPSCFLFMLGMGNVVTATSVAKRHAKKWVAHWRTITFPLKRLFRWKILCWDKRWKPSICLSQPAERLRRNSAGILNLAAQDLTRRFKGRKPLLLYFQHLQNVKLCLTAEGNPLLRWGMKLAKI